MELTPTETKIIILVFVIVGIIYVFLPDFAIPATLISLGAAFIFMTYKEIQAILKVVNKSKNKQARSSNNINKTSTIITDNQNSQPVINSVPNHTAFDTHKTKPQKVKINSESNDWLAQQKKEERNNNLF